MKIKKTKINGYDVFMYKTKKYSTIHLKFLFEMPYTKENIFMCDLLEEYMIHSNKKYKTRKELNDRRLELYSPHFGMNNYNRGVKMFTEVSFNFYDPELVKDDYLKEGLEFASSILFEPNFSDGKLDPDELSRSKDNLISYIGESLLDPHTKARDNFVKAVFPNTYQTIDIVDSKEEYEAMLDGFTDKDLISLHERLVHNSLVGLAIMGNIKDEYLNYIEEFFKFESIQGLDENYEENVQVNTETPFFIKEQDAECKESILRVLYTCPAKSIKKKLTYSVITRMIGSGGMLLHKVLRDERQLVYRVGYGYNKRTNNIVLRAYLDKSNLDSALEGIDEVIKRLEDRELLSDLLAKIKEKNDFLLYTFDENKMNLFYELVDIAFKFDISERQTHKIINSITEDDVLSALKEMKKTKIHFYEGVKE